MTKESPAIAAFKLWIFPSLVSLLGLMIWNDVNEIKADVKMLMAQSNIDKTRIDNLERVVYRGKFSATAEFPPNKKTAQPVFLEIIATKPDDQLSPQAEPAKKTI